MLCGEENCMIILGIETATEQLGAALFRDNVAYERHTASKTSHCELLTGFIGELAEEAGITFSEIDCVAVSIGPGSFTGLRIGIATAMGFAYGLGIRTAGVSTLMALAWKSAPDGSLVCPVIDAKRKELYIAGYRVHDGAVPDTLVEPCAVPISELPALFDAFHETVYFTGPAATAFRERIESTGIRCAFPSVPHSRTSAVSIAEIGGLYFNQGASVEPFGLKPLYVRRSDAEIARDSGSCK